MSDVDADAAEGARARLAAIVREVLYDRAPLAIEDDTPLFDAGIALTSVEVLELVVRLEEEFGVSLAGEELAPGRLGTFGALLARVSAGRP